MATRKNNEGLQNKRRNIKDFVKIKPLTDIDPKRVAIVAGAGLFVGAVWGILGQIASLDLKGEGDLDPPAPYMQNLEPELVILFKKFMGPFYKLCPERFKKKYQHCVKKSIRNAEAIMLIETQLLNKEIERVPEHRTQAAAHGMICLSSLRNIQNYFDTDIVLNVRDAVDVVFVNIGKTIHTFLLILISQSHF